MRRLQLFEFEDLHWFPDVLRRAMTGYLRATIELFPLPALWAEKLSALAAPGEQFPIVDLGSGSGGSMRSIILALQRKGLSPEVTLTDLYPHPDAARSLQAGNSLQYWPKPVDATSVPAELTGARTMFLSFHHHPPERARAILRDAFEKRVGIAVFEFSARKPLMMLGCLQIPLVVLAITLTMKPRRISQIFFTYLCPLLPFLMMWDALVSHLRTYSLPELQEMTADLKSPDYVWEIGEMSIPRVPGTFPWLMGRPLAQAAAPPRLTRIGSVPVSP